MRKEVALFIVAASILMAPFAAAGQTREMRQHVAAGLSPDIIEDRTAVGRLRALVMLLADQLETDIDPAVRKDPLIVTTFANLSNLKETAGFGRLMAESLMHELYVRKWSVIDVQVAKAVALSDSGEFSLSKEIEKIRDAYGVGGVLTGTYSIADDSLIVNARTIDIRTALVVSSGRIATPLEGLSGLLKPSVSGQRRRAPMPGAADCGMERLRAMKPEERALQAKRKGSSARGRKKGLAAGPAPLYYNRGIACYRAGQYDMALAYFDKAAAMNPHDAQTYYNRALTYYAEGKLNPALADFSKTIELNGVDGDAYYNRGIVRSDREEYSLAASDYCRAIDLGVLKN